MHNVKRKMHFYERKMYNMQIRCIDWERRGGGGYVPEGKIKDLAVEKERERVADWK